MAKPIWPLLKPTNLFYRPDGMLRANTEKAEQLFERATDTGSELRGSVCRDWHGSTIGLITISIKHLRERKKRVPRRRQRFVCSRICPKAHLALGFYHYYCERDYQAALQRIRYCETEFTKLGGSLYGHWCDRASPRQMERVHCEYGESGVRLSPKDAWILQNLADNYYATEKF